MNKFFACNDLAVIVFTWVKYGLDLHARRRKVF